MMRRYMQPETAVAAYELNVAGQVQDLEHEFRRHVVAWLESATPPLPAAVARRTWGRERCVCVCEGVYIDLCRCRPV